MNRDIVVVDANIAVKWIVEEADSAVADSLLVEWNSQKKFIAVPDLFNYEIANILLKKARRNFITIARAIQARELISKMEIKVYYPLNPDINIDALEIAHTYNLPAAYDAHYLALAAREQCEFWTADERLYNSVKEHFSWVHLMSDLASISVAD